MFTKNKLFACLLLFFNQSLYADDDFSNIKYKSTQLTPTIFMLEGAGGNITAQIGPDGAFLVDDDFAPMADKLLTKLHELNGGTPRFIVNTHFHYDHTGGNKVFGSTATIIGTDELRQRLMSEQILWGTKHPAEPTIALPMITFELSMSFHVNNDCIRLIHLPHGHTDGDTVVFFERNKVVSMGDLYFSGMFPIFHTEHNGSIKDYIKNIKTVMSQITDDYKIVPGHGPISTKSELRDYLEMIISCVDTVEAGIKSGLMIDQILKKGLPSKWESYSHGYASADRWISMLYAELKNNKK